MASPDLWETEDLGRASYLRLRGLKLKSVQKIPGRRKRYRFIFSDPDGKAESLSIDYINSESYRFDASMRGLKKLIYE